MGKIFDLAVIGVTTLSVALISGNLTVGLTAALVGMVAVAVYLQKRVFGF